MKIRETITFAVVVKDNEVVTVGRSYCTQPPIQSSGKPMKWYPDKMKGEN